MAASIFVLDKDGNPVEVATNDAVITELGAIRAKILAAPSTEAKQDTGNTTLASILAKITADPATQTTLAAILAKIIAAPATEAKQDTIISAVDGVETTLSSILSKIIAAPATEAKQDTGNTTLSSILSKIIAAPATEAKQDTMIAGIQRFSQSVEGEAVAASQTNQMLGTTGAAGDYLSHITITPATVSPGQVQIKDGSDTAYTIFTGGTDSVGSLIPFTIPIGETSVSGGWQITTGANVTVRAAGNFT